MNYDERGLARHSDPSTSHAAAAAVDVTAKEQAVLDAIRQFPKGCIADDIARVTGLRDGSVTPRLRPLLRKGLIQRTGESRPGMSGRHQLVHVAIDPKPVIQTRWAHQ